MSDVACGDAVGMQRPRSRVAGLGRPREVARSAHVSGGSAAGAAVGRAAGHCVSAPARSGLGGQRCACSFCSAAMADPRSAAADCQHRPGVDAGMGSPRVRRVAGEHFAYRDPGVPFYAKIFAVCVVGYIFSPIDLIPDFIPILGCLDDLILVPLGIKIALSMIPEKVIRESREKAAGK